MGSWEQAAQERGLINKRTANISILSYSIRAKGCMSMMLRVINRVGPNVRQSQSSTLSCDNFYFKLYLY